MATPPNEDSRTLFRLIADGAWHPYDEIRSKLAATVPPGRALRKYEERIEYKRKYLNDPNYDTDLSEDERIFFGARACAQIALTSWRNRGVEFVGTSENKKVRIRPGFKAWGLELPDREPEPQEDEIPEPTEDEEQQPTQGALQGPQEAVEAVEAVEGVEAAQELCGCVEAVPEEATTLIEEWSQPVITAAELTECEVCGLGMVDEARHEAWHLSQDEKKSRDDMALFSESEVRHLVTEIVSEQLDQFQVGMQVWLTTQFAQLEAQIRAAGQTPWRVRQ